LSVVRLAGCLLDLISGSDPFPGFIAQDQPIDLPKSPLLLSQIGCGAGCCEPVFGFWMFGSVHLTTSTSLLDVWSVAQWKGNVGKRFGRVLLPISVRYFLPSLLEGKFSET
jgi:hypothetical protein